MEEGGCGRQPEREYRALEEATDTLYSHQSGISHTQTYVRDPMPWLIAATDCLAWRWPVEMHIACRGHYLISIAS